MHACVFVCVCVCVFEIVSHALKNPLTSPTKIAWAFSFVSLDHNMPYNVSYTNEFFFPLSQEKQSTLPHLK
jgi:hypothetical protein